MKRWISAAVTALLIAACASAGKDFNGAKLPELQPGVSTVADATRVLGADPGQTIMLANGTRHVTWQYVTSSGFTGRTEIKQATLVFGTDGRLVRVLSLVNVPLDETARQRLQPVSTLSQ
jgi:hypothetical protein